MVPTPDSGIVTHKAGLLPGSVGLCLQEKLVEAARLLPASAWRMGNHLYTLLRLNTRNGLEAHSGVPFDVHKGSTLRSWASGPSVTLRGGGQGSGAFAEPGGQVGSDDTRAALSKQREDLIIDAAEQTASYNEHTYKAIPTTGNTS